jgi:beta-galactosidase
MNWQKLPQTGIVSRPAGMGIQIDGGVYAPYAYMSYFGKSEYYRQAEDAGIHLYCIPAFLGDRGINSLSGVGPLRKGIWRNEGVFDLHELSDEINIVMDADPEAWLLVRLNIDPPAWWEERYPEGCCLLGDGTTLRQSFASVLWRDHTEKAVRLVLQQISEKSYAERLICMHVAGSQTEEWMYRAKPEVGFQDFNTDRLAAFRGWISDAYDGDVGKLRSAWRDESLAFNTVVPADITCLEIEQRWRDVDIERSLIDTFRFHSEVVADTIDYFCRVIKDESHNRLLTGAFYGYSCYIGDPRLGHYALGKLLESPYLDILASPNVYHRVPGEDWPPMAAVDSVRLHGKLWCAENDTRTFCTNLLRDVAPDVCPEGQYDTGVWIGPESLDVSVNILWKDAGRMLAGGYGGWWFDMWGGWYSDPALLEVLNGLQEISSLYPNQDIPAMQPEVCVIHNEELCFYDASIGELTEEILGSRFALSKTGAPYTIVLPGDIDLLPQASYGFVWMRGDAGEAGWLLRPGGVTLRTTFTGSVLYDADGNELKSFPGVLSFTAGELGELYRLAGVHLYGDSGDVLYAGRGWVVLHAVEAGEKVTRLPFVARITDAVRRTVLGESDMVTLTLRQYETVLLYVEPIF